MTADSRRPEPGVMYMKTFGGFSLTWQGKVITAKAKQSSQFACLMQLLLHAGEQGVAHNLLEEALFEERMLDNPRHAIQSVIYNAKKKLRQEGLPDVNYITNKNGVFYWTREVEVREDAAEFEQLYRQAAGTKDAHERLELYLQACALYTGEFLPLQAGLIWAAQEARKYQAIFGECVEEAQKLLREEQDFIRMEELGRHACVVDPLADWEVVTMEALVTMGLYEKAQKFYDETVELYLREQGLHPTPRLMELMKRLGARMEHGYAMLEDIQKALTDTEDTESGGYLCTYPVFRGIYRMVERLMERGGQSVYLMLCTVVDSKGNPMQDNAALMELSLRLQEAVKVSVRHSDTICKYGKGQYLVLLMNTTREDCRIIQRRINRHFLVGRQRTGVQYYVNSVVCTPGGHTDESGSEKG